MSYKISREKYAAMYGPTTGDRVRLADTDLVAEIEKDCTSYGDEAKFGGGKTLRDGMGQASEITSAGGALDLVLTNAIVMDPVQGIVKADIGIKAGRIVDTLFSCFLLNILRFLDTIDDRSPRCFQRFDLDGTSTCKSRCHLGLLNCILGIFNQHFICLLVKF